MIEKMKVVHIVAAQTQKTELLDALRAVPTPEVSLELINGLSPIVLNPCDGSGKFSYMVLPVRLKAGE